MQDIDKAVRAQEWLTEYYHQWIQWFPLEDCLALVRYIAGEDRDVEETAEDVVDYAAEEAFDRWAGIVAGDRWIAEEDFDYAAEGKAEKTMLEETAEVRSEECQPKAKATECTDGHDCPPEYDPNNPEWVMWKFGWSREEFDRRMALVARADGCCNLRLRPTDGHDCPPEHADLIGLTYLDTRGRTITVLDISPGSGRALLERDGQQWGCDVKYLEQRVETTP